MSGKKRVKSTSRFWAAWLRESRTALLLYLVTVSLFLITGLLYHIENLGKMLYGALMTLAVCGMVGALQGKKYVDRCGRLENVALHYERSGELLTEEMWDAQGDIPEDCSPQAQMAALVTLVDEDRRREKNHWAETEADRKDYYMMWTHQIKTPISALKLLLEGNQDCRDSFLMREELFKIEQYAEMVLTFQRLDSISSDMELVRCDAAALLRQVVRKYSILFINKGLSAEVPEAEIQVLTDEKWFSFCLEQLLSNSIKYTSRGGIRFRIEERGKDALFILEDTGIGIRPEDLPRIFERGFTGYNGRLDKRSTGIGLYLCRQVFDRLGIGVSVQSGVGKGTQVTLTVPKPYKDVS